MDLLAAGMCNLTQHIRKSSIYGVPVVVAVNQFDSDTHAEIELIISEAKKAGMFDTLAISQLPQALSSLLLPIIGMKAAKEL